MKVKQVENIGTSSGIDYDFYCGHPAFLEDEKQLHIIINNGSDFTSVTLPLKKEDVDIVEIMNPNFSIFSAGTRGAVYRVGSSHEAMLVNVSYDGVEVASGDLKTEYYPFCDSYEGLEEVSENFDVEIEILMCALGF